MDRVVRVIGVVGVLIACMVSYWIFNGTVVADASGPTVADDDPSPFDGPLGDSDNDTDDSAKSDDNDAGDDDRDGDHSDDVDAGRPARGWSGARDGAGWSDDPVAVDTDGEPPRYLSFVAAFPSRSYHVATNREPVGRSKSSKRSKRTKRSDRSEDADYPIETDLFPHEASLAVGVEPIEPGLYASSFGVADCQYQLYRLDNRGRSRMIGEDRLSGGRMLVTIDEIEPDSFTAAPPCGSWSPWSPVVTPLAEVGDGDYWIGDLAPGAWSVPEGCLWEKVVAFRGSRLADVSESGRGPHPLVVDDETLGVRVRRCDRPMRLIAPEPDAELDLWLDPSFEP